MADVGSVVSKSVTMDLLFQKSWYQLLDTFIYYQGGELLFAACLWAKIVADLF